MGKTGKNLRQVGCDLQRTTKTYRRIGGDTVLQPLWKFAPAKLRIFMDNQTIEIG